MTLYFQLRRGSHGQEKEINQQPETASKGSKTQGHRNTAPDRHDEAGRSFEIEFTCSRIPVFGFPYIGIIDLTVSAEGPISCYERVNFELCP